jgi:hypothetical protein
MIPFGTLQLNELTFIVSILSIHSLGKVIVFKEEHPTYPSRISKSILFLGWEHLTKIKTF